MSRSEILSASYGLLLVLLLGVKAKTLKESFLKPLFLLYNSERVFSGFSVKSKSTMITEPLDLLRSNLSQLRIPEPTNRIFQHECCVSFDTPKSEGGLFIDLYTFLAFGKDYVGCNYEKTGNPVYLIIKQTNKLVPEDRL